MKSGAQKGAPARCRTGSLPDRAHVQPMRRIEDGSTALPTYRDCRAVIPSARFRIPTRALLRWCHLPVNVDSSRKTNVMRTASSTDPHVKNQDTHFHAQLPFFVFVTTVRLATCDMDASASPRNPYVVRWDRSENLDSLDVVKRCASIGRSDFCHQHARL